MITCFLFLQNPIPSNKQGVEPKRPPRPNNITSLLKLSPTVANHVSVAWAPEYGRNYTISVYLVRKLSSTDLITRLKNRGVRQSDYTRGLSKYSPMRRKNGDLHQSPLIRWLKITVFPHLKHFTDASY